MKKYYAWTFFIVLGLVVTVIISCSALYSEDLGGGYFLEKNLIVKSNTPEYKGIGRVVVPPNILELNYDETWIIASSQNMKSQKVYWIIDKRVSGEFLEQRNQDSLYWTYDLFTNIIGPIDSVTFYNKTAELEIRIPLK